MSNTVLQELDDGVLTVTFNRPDKKNAFNREQWTAFDQILRNANTDKRVAVVLLKGAGDSFCSGADLSDFSNSEPADGVEPFDACAEALIEFQKPLVAAAKGIAVGGGATILLHCDIVYVGESLRMKFPFTSLGLVPELASSVQLANIVGQRKASEIMLSSEWINADRARQLDLITDIYSDEQLFDKATSKAKELAKWPVSSLVATKVLLKKTNLATLRQALVDEKSEMLRLAGSPENREAITAIFERRQPDFAQFRKTAEAEPA
ncbi:enoyl-CoA hydratase [Endozoicomonas sp. OPT23]|uniref:enoyl-CoA hydratase-related protein n=1 Tax=Endozoicomonas sp. OPT23 TaxID=2072845 RepID=UPI00129A5AB7|nr:enoyl-CoA hydratase-related protein [Endozoicomonas sp. OPT23]MRI33880.1 enoyl-CoA hydratase [Endozoicomonas sp. OPT23]